MGKTGSPTPLEVGAETAAAFGELFLSMNPNAEIYVGGSVRRGAPIVNDVDFMVVSEVLLPELIWPGDWHVTDKQAHAKPGEVLMEVWWCPPDSVGPMALFLGGPAHFNVMCRRHANKHKMKLSQYGLFRDDERLDVPQIGSGWDHVMKMEKAFFQTLGIPYLAPEERGTTGMSAWSSPRVLEEL